jgi:threonine synthase
MSEVAKCSKCGKSFDETYENAWCTKCGEPLPESTQARGMSR